MGSELVEIRDSLRAGRDLVVATIVAHRGSTPRTSGTRMIVYPDGTVSGTIGGGAVEGGVIAAALQLFGSGDAEVLHYDLGRPDHTAGMDLICGGRVTVLLEHVRATAANCDLYGSAARRLEEGVPFLWTARAVRTDGRWRVERTIRDPAAATNGKPVATAGRQADDLVEVVEHVIPAEAVYLVGGGHVSRAIARLTRQVGFRTLVFDDREDFATARRFPDADAVHVCPGYQNIFAPFSIDAGSAIVIVTRGHHFDEMVLAQALRTEAGYIGMIGSRRKRDTIFRNLTNGGFAAGALERVRCPIGLPIGAQTPAEIGVSVVAELIEQRARRRGDG